MIKLALIGKDISHSQSEKVYRTLLKLDFSYHLLDFDQTRKIPSPDNLMHEYAGVSITSPYKRHFINEVKLDDKTKDLGAINCLYKKGKSIWGANTDYLALTELVKPFPLSNVALLGDGAMSSLCQKMLHEKKISFKVFSRKQDGDLSLLDLSKFSLVINCCSREFIFNGTVSSQTYFWDLNYHMNHPAKFTYYQDGGELLKLQAQKALEYWKLV